jgi:hypothetical protein
MTQPAFCDLSDRLAKLNEKDSLAQLNAIIDWEDFRSVLKVLRPVGKPKAAPRPYDSLLRFNIPILQSLYNISDDQD